MIEYCKIEDNKNDIKDDENERLIDKNIETKALSRIYMVNSKITQIVLILNKK